MDVTAVVPAHNEAGRVAETVRALAGIVEHVLVVDDGSTDGTDGIAARAGARVIRLPSNRGKGAALSAGVTAASSASVFLFADADLEATAANLKAILTPVLAGDADLAIAAPAPGAPSGLGLVESLSRRGIRALTGRSFERPLSGQRAMRAEVARSLRFARGFGVETAMTIDALRAGFRVEEVPCRFTHARTGRDLAGYSHRARQGADIAAALFRRWLQSGPRRGMVVP